MGAHLVMAQVWVVPAQVWVVSARVLGLEALAQVLGLVMALVTVLEELGSGMASVEVTAREWAHLHKHTNQTDNLATACSYNSCCTNHHLPENQ